MCKVTQRIIVERMLEIFLANDIITSCKHGFLPRRSAVTNHIGSLDVSSRSNDAAVPVDLDFSRSFGRVPLRRLLSKLSQLEVDWCLH